MTVHDTSRLLVFTGGALPTGGVSPATHAADVAALEAVIGSEATARAAAISAETTARQSADNLGDIIRLSSVTGTANAATGTVQAAQAHIAITGRQRIQSLWPTTNTATNPTLTIGATAYTIKRRDGSALAAGDMIGAAVYDFVLDPDAVNTMRLMGAVAVEDIAGLRGELDALTAADAATSAEISEEISARTSIADVSDTVQGEAVRLVVTGPDGRKYILVHIDDDGTTTFARPVSLPSGSLPLSAIDTDDLAALPFSLSTSILLSSMRIVAEGPDGRQYILMDIPVDGSSPIDTYVSRALSGGTGGGASTDTIVAVGDSMTAAGSGIIDVLPGRFPGRLVVDSAEGGERTEGIAVSFGVPDLLTYAVTGNAIPTSGTVNVTPNISHLNSGASALVDVIGETGLAVRCRVHNNAGTYHLRPIAYPAAAIRVQSPARARVVSLQVSGSDPTLARLLDPLYDGTAIFRDGRNDIGYDKGYDGAALIALTQRMVALMRSGRYIVLGVTNGTSDVPTANGGSSGTISEANSLISMSNVVDLNSRRAAAFPGRFFSPMANFQDVGQTDTITVSGQSFEMTAAAVLVDGIHENSTGKNLTCDLIEAAFAALEY